MRSRFVTTMETGKQPRSKFDIAGSRPAADRKTEALSALELAVIYAQERDEPQNRPRIDWKLITDLPVQSTAEAIEQLDGSINVISEF